MVQARQSGILLHITSLPSGHGIGGLGLHARRFADFLHEGGQRIWQVLPLNPTSPEGDNSPYSGSSAFAGNPLLISPEMLVHEGFLQWEDVSPAPLFPRGRVDYPAATAYKTDLLCKAFARFDASRRDEIFQGFLLENDSWLPDYALFVALRERFQGLPWNRWPPDLRDRRPDALESALRDCRDRVEFEMFTQYLFFRQWTGLKAHCNGLGIRIFGDLPIYVNYDSCDVWTHPELFRLDKEKNPVTVAGVPPDYFSSTGQLWGNPVYRWDHLRADGYAWWIQRIEHNLRLFDLIRIDHFRGFVAYWEVPAEEKTAMGGRWAPGPGDDFFHVLRDRFRGLPIVAEDLGFITQDVRDLMDRFGLPGMKLLLFAFNDDPGSNPYVPHNHVENCLVYTGTHDNNTTRGWFEWECSEEIRGRIETYLGRKLTADNIAREMSRLALMSVARTAILPLQDILGLGGEARMNTPATSGCNWQWQLVPEQLTSQVAHDLGKLTRLYGRI